MQNLYFSKLIDFYIGKLIWQLTHDQLPDNFQNILKIDITTKSNRKMIMTEKYTPLCRTKYKEHFLSTTGPVIWRKIPDSIKKIKSKNLFSSKYYQYLMDN